MLKSYDLDVNPTTRTRHLITLSELMEEIACSESESRDDYLKTLIYLFEVSARDLHCLLEGNELPENRP
ncbi:hypothetical protein QEG60_003405 [Pluralibacter gergoviae]|uniref:hypothetical protein n=1 Tax=Pluralibacter gergoviae TaxID=61647 RepID=UPI000A3754DC|nr:hypothetical protein [Pluralibacter gergoviae]EKV3544686.1 hypothetical protein [Pluralibacter gergoviae]EKV9900313.1 hypothetical protein [Pluralibacter gergoviae]EKV9930844.1 hypothetical protein [Pluralibacter gergoviae]OUF43706.1 hypothetical protein AZ034_004371 [Pluralibacter gergoviae]OUF55467.1 hypothetical protein AZ044_001717 [Pluralibacter gergoviae]